MSFVPVLPLQISSLRVKRSRDFELHVPDLSLAGGRVVCIAGANGSGKTTLIECIAGLLSPGARTVQIFGVPLEPNSLSAKRALGFIPDDDAWIVNELTAREYFGLLTSIYREAGLNADIAQAVERLANRLSFTSFDLQLGSLSHGNKKKVQIIAGLMHNPPLLVIDELRNGLDPIAIKQAETLLKEYAETGTAIIAATHDLWWAERFADEIVMLHQGKVVLRERTADIVAAAGSVEARFMELYPDPASHA